MVAVDGIGNIPLCEHSMMKKDALIRGGNYLFLANCLAYTYDSR